MPLIGQIFGMTFYMYYDDHDPPHFHVRSAWFKAKVDIGDTGLNEVTGRMRPQDANRVRTWALWHRAPLLENWERARRKEPLERIED